MKTTEKCLIPAERMAELQASAEQAANGIRNREAMRTACTRMDHTREEIRKRCGVLDFAVPTIRGLRDGDEA